ncbi:MAG: class I SAM-dependent methyltransferase [Firmicutes bacterium]|nr:class I SAM-dependent methyltransferase [Bacillota bacterium]
MPRNIRVSNGLKDFLWLIGDVQHGQLLDFGTVWQSTVSFFTERRFKVYTADLLRTWRDFLAEDERRRIAAARRPGAEVQPPDYAGLADAFIAANLAYAPETFRAVLAWDLFDYLPEEVSRRIVDQLYGLLQPGGVVLAMFHSRLPDAFHRYRVLDGQHIEVLHAPPLLPPLRVFQNREILALFERFRSSKTYVGRDQLREGLFAK